MRAGFARWATSVACTTLALAAVALSTEPNPASAGQTLASVALTDDDGGAAMFSTADLAPGHPASNCIDISYLTGPSGGEVFVGALDVSGPLSSHLVLRIEEGTGGTFGNCAGFSGTEIFSGTLAQLAAVNARGVPGTLSTWSPAQGAHRSFRISTDVTGNVGVQGAAGAATFVWTRLDDPASPTPTPSPTDSPSPSPSGSPSDVLVSPSPSVSATPSALPSAAPSPGVPASPSGSPGVPHDGGPRGSTPTGGHSGWGRLAPLVTSLTTLASGIAHHSGFPIAVLVLLFGFLMVQNRLDRRDPKLAAAPVFADPALSFEPVRPDDRRDGAS